MGGHGTESAGCLHHLAESFLHVKRRLQDDGMVSHVLKCSLQSANFVPLQGPLRGILAVELAWGFTSTGSMPNAPMSLQASRSNTH
jgi:hypothetical protein